MHPLAQRVLAHIRRQELLHAGDRVGVAVSGGIDSVALLRLLLELRNEFGIVVSLVHFNHQLRGAESDGDQEFVADLAREHDLQFYCDSDDVAGHAADEGVSLEVAARELRYGFFQHLLNAAKPQGLNPSTKRGLNGTAEAVPFHGSPPLRSAHHDPEAGGTHQAPTRQSESMARAGDGTRAAPLNKILTAHTLDDQAETVLMRVIRGAGLKGLGGIHPRILIEDNDGELSGEILRPLLAFRRRELKQYLFEIRQSWREDSTNASAHFTRNRVRQLVVPLLEQEFNPAIAENLSELAEIARGEEDYWDNEIAGWMGTAVHWSHPDWVGGAARDAGLVQIASPKQRAGVPAPHGPARSPSDADLESRIEHAPWLVMDASLDRIWFLGEPVAVQRRVVKAIGEEAGIPLEFRHVEEILRFAAESGSSGKEWSLPLGWKVVREPEQLVFITPDLREPNAPRDYQYELLIPGRIVVGEVGSTIEVSRVLPGTGYNPDHLLNANSLSRPLWVRNWRAGDRFWPSHTKSPKKVKELLQERHIAEPERKLWPVVVSKEEDEIVWIRGFPVAARFRAKPGEPALLILETPLSADITT